MNKKPEKKDIAKAYGKYASLPLNQDMLPMVLKHLP